MNNSVFKSHRAEVLSRARGQVLEIGFGTGANLPYYPATVSKLTALEPNEGMRKYIAAKLGSAPVKIEVVQGSAEEIPFPDRTFDTVVSTLTLCSVSDIDRVLREIRRVLKTDGVFLFFEHGLHPSHTVARFQALLNPLNKKLADGCQITRNISALISKAGFDIKELRNEILPKAPPTHSYFYKGYALRGER